MEQSSRKLVAFLVIFEIALVICYGILGGYAIDASPVPLSNPAALYNGDGGQPQTTTGGESIVSDNSLPHFYQEFQDVHVMIYIGFGFLMTFLKRYGFSSVAINLLLAAIVVQWHLLLHGLFHLDGGRFKIDILQMILSEFCAGAVLISMGAVLGKISPTQYVVMAVLETVCYTCNEYLFERFGIVDAGGSMNLHAFGAYFGLAVSRVLYAKHQSGTAAEGSVYHSDLFSMIGTIFLWLFWPSFNGATAAPIDGRHRAVINTYISLTSCTLFAFAMSSIVDKKGKFNMVHIQNATLAGGVAMGTAANLMVQPYGAMIIGAIAGVVSVLGFQYLQPFLHDKIGLHDTCGVNNLHGMPGIIGGLVGIIATAMATPDSYGSSYYTVFPALSSSSNGSIIGSPRSVAQQAVYQLIGLATSLGIGIVGGAITGFILKLKICEQPATDNECFEDSMWWQVPDLETKVVAKVATVEAPPPQYDQTERENGVTATQTEPQLLKPCVILPKLV